MTVVSEPVLSARMTTPVRATALLLTAAVLALGACGGASDEDQVRDTVQRLGKASADKDYQEICDALVAEELIRSVEAVGLPCELAFKRGLDPVKDSEDAHR